MIMRNQVAVLAWAAVLILPACGRRGQAPEPPRLGTELVRDLFRALEDRDYERARPKIARLRELHPARTYLGELDHAVATNLLMRRIQEQLDANRPAAAAELAAAAIRERGRLQELLELETQCAALQELQTLVQTCCEPPRAAVLARAAARLRMLAATKPEWAAFQPAAERQLARARQLSEREQRRAIEDLCADIEQAQRDGDSETVAYLHAVLEVAAPDHPLVQDWRRKLTEPSPPATP